MPTVTGLSRIELIDLVRTTVVDSPRWLPYVHFNADERYFHRLRGDDLVDVWLLTWLPGQSTDLHDHGGSAAAISVVRGTLHEEHADFSGRYEHHYLEPGGVHWLDPDAVHDVYNSAGPPAVSIHAYSPPLHRMTFYRRTAGRLEPFRTMPTREPTE